MNMKTIIVEMLRVTAGVGMLLILFTGGLHIFGFLEVPFYDYYLLSEKENPESILYSPAFPALFYYFRYIVPLFLWPILGVVWGNTIVFFIRKIVLSEEAQENDVMKIHPADGGENPGFYQEKKICVPWFWLNIVFITTLIIALGVLRVIWNALGLVPTPF